MQARLRQGTQWISQKFGKRKATEDEEFNAVNSKQDKIHKTTQKLTKHLNQLVENFHAMTTTLQFIAEDFKEIYQPNDEFRSVAEDLLLKAAEIEKNYVIPYQENNARDCIDKLTAYEVQFPPLNDLVSARKKKLLDYDYYKDKVQSLTEKPSKDPLALPKAKEKLSVAKEEYDAINNETKGRMREIIDQRCEVLDPTLSALIKNLIEYTNGVAQTLSKLQVHSNVSISKKPQPISQQTLYPPQPNPRDTPVPKQLDIEWFYLDENVSQKGPISIKQLKLLFKQGKMNDETYVFGGDMNDWSPIKKIPDLYNYLKE